MHWPVPGTGQHSAAGCPYVPTFGFDLRRCACTACTVPEHCCVCAAQSQSNEALRGLTRTLDAAAAEAEVTLAPIARRQAEQAQRQLQQLEHQWKEASAEYERSGRSQQPQDGSHRHRPRGSSSDGDWE
jgi:hypothetical protein